MWPRCQMRPLVKCDSVVKWDPLSNETPCQMEIYNVLANKSTLENSQNCYKSNRFTVTMLGVLILSRNCSVWQTNWCLVFVKLFITCQKSLGTDSIREKLWMACNLLHWLILLCSYSAINSRNVILGKRRGGGVTGRVEVVYSDSLYLLFSGHFPWKTKISNSNT